MKTYTEIQCSSQWDSREKLDLLNPDMHNKHFLKQCLMKESTLYYNFRIKLSNSQRVAQFNNNSSHLILELRKRTDLETLMKAMVFFNHNNRKMIN